MRRESGRRRWLLVALLGAGALVLLYATRTAEPAALVAPLRRSHQADDFDAVDADSDSRGSETGYGARAPQQRGDQPARAPPRLRPHPPRVPATNAPTLPRAPALRAHPPRAPATEAPTLPRPAPVPAAPTTRAPSKPRSPPARPGSGGGVWATRRAAVVAAMQHAWQGYRHCGWGADEYKPRSCTSLPAKWGGIGMTLLDSMDTLWLMGLHEEFGQAVAWCRDHLKLASRHTVSVFETTIRALGGLLAAHALSGELVLLERARVLGDWLLGTMHPKLGIPCKTSALARSGGGCAEQVGLAEAGSVQLELRQLSAASGDPKYARAANRIYRWAADSPAARTGWFGSSVQRSSGALMGPVSFGGDSDSFFEYLLKGWLQGGRRETRLWDLYAVTVEAMRGRLLHSTDGGQRYVGTSAEPGKMEHLTCWLPGGLAVGGHFGNRSDHMELAHQLMATCYDMYAKSPLKLSPERVYFGKSGFSIRDEAPWTMHRPETVESLYMLWVTSKREQYREWGWKIFQAIEECCKTTYGYGAHPDVRKPSSECCKGNDDRTETYFLAETLKYLFLLFSDTDPSRLEKYVFNTEAHPFPIASGHSPTFPLFE